VQLALLVLSIAGYIGLSMVLILGWRRWLRRSSPPSRLASLSLAGFVFGSASAVLAIGTMLYSMTTEGFRFYDPTLLKLYKAGMLLALGGLVFALIGVWSRNSLRWHAPGLSFGMLLLWFIWASGE
jgi:hypothetical protein